MKAKFKSMLVEMIVILGLALAAIAFATHGPTFKISFLF